MNPNADVIINFLSKYVNQNTYTVSTGHYLEYFGANIEANEPNRFILMVCSHLVAAENEFRKVTGRSSGLDCGWTYDNLDDAITVIDTVLNHFNMQANVTRLKNDFGNYRGNIYIAGFIYQ